MAGVSSPVPSLHPVAGSAAELLALLREWDAATHPEPLVIVTSGSTGQPKRVVLSRDAVRASALATQERLGGPGQWVLNLPPTYVAGVQVLYRSVVAGTEPVVMEPGDDFESVRDRMSAVRAYVSLVPTQLFRQLQDGGSEAHGLGRFDAVLIGGGPLAPDLRAEAEAAGIRVVQTYGMSETCGGCVYDGVPLDGVELRIGADGPEDGSDEGEVLLRGPMLFDGYEDDPGRTAAALRDGWFHTDDLGRVEDGRLKITGRRDDMIISGGLKIPAVAVEQMLAAHPAVDDVVVLGMPDEEWGERVTAFWVHNGEDMSGLDEAVTPREWAPKRWSALTEIPRLPNGKPDRIALRAMA
jgi:O-succinylbenzoic acid--CoA ligase